MKKMIRGHKTNVVALFSFFLLFAAYEPLRAFTEALGSPSSVHSPKREDVDLGTPKQPPEESAAAAAAAAASRDSGSESGAADSAASLRSSAGGPSSSSGDSRLPGPSGSSNSKANLNGTPAPRERGAGDVVCSTGEGYSGFRGNTDESSLLSLPFLFCIRSSLLFSLYS